MEENVEDDYLDRPDCRFRIGSSSQKACQKLGTEAPSSCKIVMDQFPQGLLCSI